MSVKLGNINISYIAGISKIYYGNELILFKSYEDYTKDELLKICEERLELAKNLFMNQSAEDYPQADRELYLNKLIALHSVKSAPEKYDKSEIIEKIKDMNAQIEKLQSYIASGGGRVNL